MKVRRPGVLRRHGAAIAAITLALLATALVLPISGVVTPRLDVRLLEGDRRAGDGDTKTVVFQFHLVNSGWTDVTILGMGRSSSFMRLLKTERTHFPLTLAPGQAAPVGFVYRVTDCVNLSREEWPIPVQVERPWGTQNTYIDPSPLDPNPSNGAVPDNWRGTVWTHWYVALASDVCTW